MWDEGYRPSIRHDLQYRELEDGGVIYDTTAERIHTLNVAAAYIWNCCDGSRTPSRISRRSCTSRRRVAGTGFERRV